MTEPVITIKQGKIRGKTGIQYDGGTYYSFQGIPYAKPPVGKLRFKAPEPAEQWEGIRDATKEGSGCYSYNLLVQQPLGSEDCLFLNVYTTEISANERKAVLKPVMVYIHGGGFTTGSGSTDLFGPEFLLIHDIVLVTINYRVGLLGFLRFDDAALNVPGNAGLKDSVLALQWVQENISNFLGDPTNVTIFGESAGGAAVHYLTLSPLAKGLFHGAIIQSGVALNPWTTGYSTLAELAEVAEIDTKVEEEIFQYLQDIPVEKLLEIQRKMPDLLDENKLRPYGPVVESPPNQSSFLPFEPLEIILSGKLNAVPILIGYCNREGMMTEGLAKLRGTQAFHNDFEKKIPREFNLKIGSAASKEVALRIRQFYFGKEEPSLETKDSYYLLDTDIMFIRGIYSVLRNLVSVALAPPIYLYRFSLETDLNIFKKLVAIQEPGASHGDDLGYLFKTMFTPEVKQRSVEDIAIRKLTKIWTTFAKYGTPVPPEKDILVDVEWKPVDATQMNFVDISETLTADVNPENARMKFWDEIEKTYANASKP